LSDLAGVPPSIVGNSIIDLQMIDLSPGQVLRFDGGTTGTAEIYGESFVDFKSTAVSLVGSTKLRVSGNGSIAIRGSLSGTGGLIVDSTRDVALTGDLKSFSGDTVVNHGRLVVASALAASAITINAGGEVFAYEQNGIRAQLFKLFSEGGIFSGYNYQCQDLR
jgi:hypothetical protein